MLPTCTTEALNAKNLSHKRDAISVMYSQKYECGHDDFEANLLISFVLLQVIIVSRLKTCRHTQWTGCSRHSTTEFLSGPFTQALMAAALVACQRQLSAS